MTSVAGEACFGVYTDRTSVPDADALAAAIAASVDELGEVAALRASSDGCDRVVADAPPGLDGSRGAGSCVCTPSAKPRRRARR